MYNSSRVASLLCLLCVHSKLTALCFWIQTIRLHKLSSIQIYTRAIPREGHVVLIFLFSSSNTCSA